MEIKPIGQDRIAAMLAQLRASAPHSAVATLKSAAPAGPTGGASFADALKVSLERVNQSQLTAESLSQQFALGDERVSLSDVMIERQKASLSLQATVQVRNKLVSAYHEIMSMQV